MPTAQDKARVGAESQASRAMGATAIVRAASPLVCPLEVWGTRWLGIDIGARLPRNQVRGRHGPSGATSRALRKVGLTPCLI